MFINFEHHPLSKDIFFFELETQDFAALGAYVSAYIGVLVTYGAYLILVPSSMHQPIHHPQNADHVGDRKSPTLPFWAETLTFARSATFEPCSWQQLKIKNRK